jgi:transcriptional regulator with PAS, ATPase and Fis domain
MSKNAQAKRIRKLIAAGQDRVQIAIALGISTDTLRTWMRDMGINMPRRSHSLADVEDAYKAEGSCAAAARKLRITRQAVHARLKAAGLLAAEAGK